jgi:lipoprotein-anchoring transpeptidase ErfK/SrfK
MTTIAHIGAALPVLTRIGSGRRIGTVPSRSIYLGARMSVPLLARSADGRWGKVRVPWHQGHGPATGWIELRGLRLTHTPYVVVVSRTRRLVTLRRNGHVVARMAAGIGAPATPTPRGFYWVTERTPVLRERAAYGSFAFGLSGLQPNLPLGWPANNNQLAIHGTGDASSIGQARSAGCVRVSEGSLARLRRVLVAGTPVIVRD